MAASSSTFSSAPAPVTLATESSAPRNIRGLVIRPESDFKALPERGRPGGSSPDSQYFLDVSNGDLWIGKCDTPSMTLPQTWANNSPGTPQYLQEYRELLGAALYDYFQIPCAETVLSDQKAVHTAIEVYNCDNYAACPHVMSKMVSGFIPYGKDFVDDYRVAVACSVSSLLQVTPLGETTAIPLRGLGAALAVAAFIYDYDCIGNAGGNIGYVKAVDALGKSYAKTVKIDPGFAFGFLDKERKVERHVEIGTTSKPLQFDELNAVDQAEFAQMAKRILAAPWDEIEMLVRRFEDPQGLPRAFINNLLKKLLTRKKDFLNVFYSEVDIHLRREVQQEREAVLLRWATLPPSPPLLISHEKTVEGKGERGPGLATVASRTLATAPLASSPSLLSAESKSSSSALITSSLKGLDEKEQATRYLRLLLQGMLPTEQKEAKASLVQTFQLPPVTAHFTGRDTLLTQLADTLSRQHGGVISQAISGLGGIGKTQLAARYAELAQQGARLGAHRLAYDAVIWLYAERDLSNQFTVLAQSWFGIQGLSPEETREGLHLQLQHQRVLMVFDNATDASDLTPYLDTFKGGHYHILITSRQADWQAIPTLRLTGFSSTEGQAYVQKHLPGAKTEEITPLLDAVAFLPLALSHAVAYIREKYCTLSEYPRVFALHQLSLKPSLTVSDTGQTVMTTFLLTVRRLALQFPEIEAILQAAAYLAPDAIPLDFLLEGVQQNNTTYPKSGLTASLDALVQHSLVQHDKTKQTVNLHRLVQGAICAYHAHKEGAEGVQRHVVAWAEYSVKKLKYSEKDSADALRVSAFIPHVWALVSILQQHEAMGKIQTLRMLLQRIGSHQVYGIGAYREGQKAYAAALAWVEKYYSPDHLEVASSLANLGNALRRLGDAQGAKPLLERALMIKEKHYLADHPEVARTLGNLGSTLLELGDAQGAKLLQKRALTIKEKHYPADHPEVANTLVNLGNTLRELGDAPGAKPLLERALTINKKHYPADHPEVAITLTNLGNTLRELGDAPGAKSLLERALTIKEKHYPADHPQVATTLGNLGGVLLQLGDAPGAKPLLERALMIKEKRYPTNHPEVARTLGNLGFTLQELGDVLGAKKHLTRAHQIFLSQFGATHLDTQRAARMLKELEENIAIPTVRESKPLATPALSAHPAALRASTSSSSRSSAPTPQRRSDKCVIS